jgi:hypothetical protein
MKKPTTAPQPAPLPEKFDAAAVADLLCEGHRISHIRDILEASGIPRSAAAAMVEQAIENLVSDGAALSENARRAWLFVSGKNIYRKQNELGDYSGAVQTLKALSLFKRPLSAVEVEEQEAFLRFPDG